MRSRCFRARCQTCAVQPLSAPELHRLLHASRAKVSCIKNQGLNTTLTLRAGNLNLTGPLPDVAASDSPLQVLTLYNNHLTGTLPASLGSATQLTNLDVSSNNLTGAFFAAGAPCVYW